MDNGAARRPSCTTMRDDIKGAIAESDYDCRGEVFGRKTTVEAQ